MTKRRFQAVFAAILAQACAEPHAPTVSSAPAPTALSTIDPPLDAGVDAAPAAEIPRPVPPDAAAPKTAVVQQETDPRLLRERAGHGIAFTYAAKDWPKLAPSALPPNVTFVAFVSNGVVSDAIGTGPPAATIVAEHAAAVGDAGPSAAYEKTIAWVAGGRLAFGDRHDLFELLSPFDSAAKAALLLHFGYGAVLREDRATRPNGSPCLLCDGPHVRAKNDGFEVLAAGSAEEALGPCPQSNPTTVFFLTSYFVAADGHVSVSGTAHPYPEPHIANAPCIGRDTHGSGRAFRSPVSVGDYFAQLAHDEAISVRSFERLARELEKAGNRALSARARVAARQERDHARRMGVLCRDHGGTPRALPRTGKLDTRPLAEWLVENVREGCVNETFAALVAAWQADHAPDIAMRRTFRVIAEQEREHARLAADIHAWAIGRFPELAPTLDAARSDAVGRLRASLGPGRTDVGEPPRRVAERFVAGLDQIFAA
ncbi:MAG TPA: hypothetical protein VF407_00480 [Polyangiaceae bacterium]